jgi:hypothetical protein
LCAWFKFIIGDEEQYVDLLMDEDVRRWFDNLAAKSIVTRLFILGL